MNDPGCDLMSHENGSPITFIAPVMTEAPTHRRPAGKQPGKQVGPEKYLFWPHPQIGRDPA